MLRAAPLVLAAASSASVALFSAARSSAACSTLRVKISIWWAAAMAVEVGEGVAGGVVLVGSGGSAAVAEVEVGVGVVVVVVIIVRDGGAAAVVEARTMAARVGIIGRFGRAIAPSSGERR